MIVTDRWFAWIERLAESDRIAVQCAAAMAWILIIYLLLICVPYPGHALVRRVLHYATLVMLAAVASLVVYSWPIGWSVALVAIVSGVLWLTRKSGGQHEA